MNSITRAAVVGVQRAVALAVDLVPETTDRAVPPAAASGAVVEVVDMVAFIIATAMEEITVEVPRLTGGATKLAFNIKDSTKQANMETTCNLARLYLV